MSRKSLLRAALLLLPAALLVLVFLRVDLPRPNSIGPTKDYPRFARFHSTGIVHSHIENGKTLFTIRADEITHKKRKLGPFTINPLKEIVMVNVRVEVDAEALRERISEKGENMDAFQTLSGELTKKANLKGLGFISNVLIKGIELALVRDGRRQITVTAKRVTAGIGSRHPVFHDLSAVSADGQHLAARTAEWITEKRLLFVPRRYTLTQKDGATSGRRAFFSITETGTMVRITNP